MLIISFAIFSLILSAIFHEYAHGWAAYKLGDNTAKDAGRLTLNPMAHIDIFGSIILPLLLVISKMGFIIGWAKPVPYNPYNLRDPKFGDLKVAIAGPGMNLILALISGLIARFTPILFSLKQSLIIGFFKGNYDFLSSQMHGSIVTTIFVMAIIFCFINLLLMLFNLIPIPPLDGSKVLMTFLSPKWQIRMHSLEPYGILIILFLVMFGFFDLIWPALIFLFSLIIGIF